MHHRGMKTECVTAVVSIKVLVSKARPVSCIAVSIGRGILPIAEEHGFVLQPSSPNNELLLKEVLIITLPQLLDLLPSVKPSDHVPAELMNEVEITDLISYRLATGTDSHVGVQPYLWCPFKGDATKRD